MRTTFFPVSRFRRFLTVGRRWKVSEINFFTRIKRYGPRLVVLTSFSKKILQLNGVRRWNVCCSQWVGAKFFRFLDYNGFRRLVGDRKCRKSNSLQELSPTNRIRSFWRVFQKNNLTISVHVGFIRVALTRSEPPESIRPIRIVLGTPQNVHIVHHFSLYLGTSLWRFNGKGLSEGNAGKQGSRFRKWNRGISMPTLSMPMWFGDPQTIWAPQIGGVCI